MSFTDQTNGATSPHEHNEEIPLVAPQDPSYEHNEEIPLVAPQDPSYDNNTEPQQQLSPRPLMDLPEQVLPTSPADPQESHNTDTPDSPLNLQLPHRNILRIMRKAVPPHAIITKKSNEDMEKYVREFIQFLTSEAVENVSVYTHRKTIVGEDIIEAMDRTGFENYAEALRSYLAAYRAERFEGYSPEEENAKDTGETAVQD